MERIKMLLNKVISGLFFFDPSDKIYSEHFPENPVVPGSIITDAFVSVIKQKSLKPMGCRIRNFRFKRFITPGEYHYDIIPDASGFSCRLYDNKKTAVTGRVVV